MCKFAHNTLVSNIAYFSHFHYLCITAEKYILEVAPTAEVVK